MWHAIGVAVKFLLVGLAIKLLLLLGLAVWIYGRHPQRLVESRSSG